MMLKKILFLGIFLISVMGGDRDVFAKEYQDSFNDIAMWIPNTYIVKEKNGVKRYQQMSLMERNSDGEFVYCIEPGAKFDSDAILNGTDENQAYVANISESVWERISLLAYYGYGYGDHKDLKWYSVTQFLIWKSVPHGYDIYFTDTLNGKRIEKYKEEIAELERLVQEHKKVPSFHGEKVSLKLGEDLELVDENGVLSFYMVEENEFVDVKNVGNKLVVTAKKSGSSTLHLTKKDGNLHHPTIVYVDPVMQDIIVRGAYQEIDSLINIEVLEEARVKVIKVDDETNEVLKLSGIRFKIKNLDTNEYVCFDGKACEFVTNEDGFFVTPSPLVNGRYQIEEVDQMIDGYLWNKEALVFEIGPNTKFINDPEYGKILEVQFSNIPVLGEVEIKKIGEKAIIEDGNYFYQEALLDGVCFQVYAAKDIYSGGHIKFHKGDLVKEIRTKNGYAKINGLFLGDYYLVEKETVDGHILDTKKHYFSIKYQDQYTPIVSVFLSLKNKLPKSRLEFTKIDHLTKEGIDDTEIEIYTWDDKLVFRGVTNEDGKIILDDLFVGKFYIIETRSAKGYIKTNEKVWFEVSEEDSFLNVAMENEKEIKVPKTDAENPMSPIFPILDRDNWYDKKWLILPNKKIIIKR